MCSFPLSTTKGKTTAKLAPISPISNLSPTPPPPHDTSSPTSTRTKAATTVTAKCDDDDDVRSSIKIDTVRSYATIIHDEPHHESADSESENCAEYTSSKLSSLPVAMVVEQTARILEDIKKKIQLQKQEEEKLRRDEEEKEMNVKSPTILRASSRYARDASEERTYSASSTKSFIILSNNRYGDAATPSKHATSNTSAPQAIATIPRSLSPDSGTDFSLPFSASSSISPPFLKRIDEKGNNNLASRNNPYVDYAAAPKFPHNASDNEIFKSLTSYNTQSSYASSSVIYATPKYTAISPTSPMSSKRRLSGITIPQYATSSSLAKSSPSIAADLMSETQASAYALKKPTATVDDQYQLDHLSHHHHHHPFRHHQQQQSQQHVRPLSFQVLQSAATEFTFETYHSPSLDYASTKTRYKSLANLPTGSITTSSIVALRPLIVSTVASTLNSRTSQLGSGNARQAFGDDPAHIKPISSALEYQASNKSTFQMSTNYQHIQSIDTLHSLKVEKTSSNSLDKSTKSFDDTLIMPRFEHLSRNLEKSARPLPTVAAAATTVAEDEASAAQADYFLSLSLSPPMNRRTKNLLMLKGIGLSL